jgi:hypothetical protein
LANQGCINVHANTSLGLNSSQHINSL